MSTIWGHCSCGDCAQGSGVTGASTGLGLETALRLAGEGFAVYATVRDPAQRTDVLQAAAERHLELSALRLEPVAL